MGSRWIYYVLYRILNMYYGVMYVRLYARTGLLFCIYPCMGKNERIFVAFAGIKDDMLECVHMQYTRHFI